MRSLLIAAAVLALAGAAKAQPPAANPCASADHHRFDFWIGKWDVTVTGETQVIAHSLIEGLYGGCTIRENWNPLKGQPGGSLSAYDATSKVWRQAWSDSSGAWVEFEGGWTGKALVITGGWPGAGQAGRLVRMTYTKGADGSVRQAGEQSLDEGKTWTPSFDFTYRRAVE